MHYRNSIHIRITCLAELIRFSTHHLVTLQGFGRKKRSVYILYNALLYYFGTVVRALRIGIGRYSRLFCYFVSLIYYKRRKGERGKLSINSTRARFHICIHACMHAYYQQPSLCSSIPCEIFAFYTFLFASHICIGTPYT